MYMGQPVRQLGDLSAEPLQARKVAQYIQSTVRKKFPTKSTLRSAIIQN